MTDPSPVAELRPTRNLRPTTNRRFHVFLRREALAAGYSERAITALVRSGDWVRIRRGAYMLRGDWAQLDDSDRHAAIDRAVLKQAGTRLVLSHGSAVPEHGGPIYGLDLSEVHVTRLDQKAGRVEAGVHQHQGVLREHDVTKLRGVEVTSATKTALDVTTTASVEAALCVVNDFLHRQLTTMVDLKKRYASMEMDPNTLRTELVLRLADARIESVGESRTFFLCWRHHIPMPQPQASVRDDAGIEVARVDFAWPEQKVYLEFDGKVKYTTLLKDGQTAADVLLAEKRRDQLIYELTGWRCIRITWADLEHPERTAARILHMLSVTPSPV